MHRGGCGKQEIFFIYYVMYYGNASTSMGKSIVYSMESIFQSVAFVDQ